MKTKVTLITPCYNGENHIISYINGLLAQTNKNVQYVFVNDGSTDKTEELILSYQKAIEAKGWDFNYIFQEHKGQAAAINKALLIADGDYLSCIDSDDILMPSYIEDLSNYLDNNKDCGICFPTAEFIEENSYNHIKFRKRIIDNDVVDNFVEDMLLRNENLPAFPSFMLRMTEFKKYTPSGQIYEGLSGQNPQLILPIAYNTRIGYIDKMLIRIVRRHDSDSSSDLYIKSYNWEDLYCKVLNQIPNMPEHEKTYLYTEIKNRWKNFRYNFEKSIQKPSHKVVKIFGIKFKFRIKN